MTDKLKGIEPGQRVRVTFEGVVMPDRHTSMAIHPDGSPDTYRNVFSTEIVSHPSFKIEPIEEPIKPNDPVRAKDGVEGVVVWVDGTRAWVVSGLCDRFYFVADLERVK